MSDRKITRPGNWFATPEVSNALFKLSGASIAIANGIATVTLTNHLLATGDLTTFSGVTGAGVTGLNAATWGPVTVTGANTYTFPTSLAGTPGGTIVQEKLYFPVAGQWFCVLAANGQLEYNPDNTLGAAWNQLLANFTATANATNMNTPGGPGTAAGPDTTWRILIPASGAGDFNTDGFSVRFRENGTTATSVFSQIA